MKTILRQVAGIDVAQKELVVSLGRKNEDYSDEIYAHKVFINGDKGFVDLVNWVKKMSDPKLVIQFVMEATGVYHERFAFFLTDNDHQVSIVLPNLISNFSRTLDVKTVNDKTSSEAIAKFGLSRILNQWRRPNPVYKQLKQLSRELDQVVTERTAIKNQLHAEMVEAEPNKSSVKRSKTHITLLDKFQAEIKAEMATLISSAENVKKSVDLICTIPGIAEQTVAIVLAETNGFEMIRNKSQLISFAGLDVVEKQSGTSVKGKTRISKRGNRHLRKALHMPSLSAVRYNEKHKALFARLVSKHGIKMKALVAVQKKMLELMYTIHKTQKPYDKNHTSLALRNLASA